MGLGFNPLYAAGLCLIANTAPVAFGAMGIPIIVAGQVTGLDPFAIGAKAGHQLPFLSVLVPFWLVMMMDGLKGVRQTWPAVLVAGGSFAITQYFTSNYIGPELPDITSALVSLVCLTLFLKVWRPREIFTFAGRRAQPAPAFRLQPGADRPRLGAVPDPDRAGDAVEPEAVQGLVRQGWRAGALGAEVSCALPGQSGDQDRAHRGRGQTLRGAVQAGPAVRRGHRHFVAALLSMLLLRFRPAQATAAFGETLLELKRPILSIGMVLAFAFVANYSGMSSTLALCLAKAFPSSRPSSAGWGVPDRFRHLVQCLVFGLAGVHRASTGRVGHPAGGGQYHRRRDRQDDFAAVHRRGLRGGGAGGQEADLFRFTLKHSLIFCSLVGR